MGICQVRSPGNFTKTIRKFMMLTQCRDGGLPFSKFFSRVHPKLELPLNALLLTLALDVIFGCIFLGSSSAFNAILSASVVALGVSYAIPVLINCIRGRRMLGERPFVLPGPIGWIANLVCPLTLTIFERYTAPKSKTC